MAPDLIKFLVKVLDENEDRLCWEHLCYAPRGLYLKYLKAYHLERFEMADCVSRWAKEDFNTELSMTTFKDIQVLRQLVLDKYKSVYPHIVRDSATDRQGWVRTWVADHMERDLDRDGKR